MSSSSNNSTKKRKLMETDEKSDDSAAHKKAKDREARRKRREAVVEEEEVKAGAHGATLVNLAKKKNKGEDVIRVPMLTGTLLLYRGLHRRAEFIYKK